MFGNVGAKKGVWKPREFGSMVGGRDGTNWYR
jgi:hypothetical protein